MSGKNRIKIYSMKENLNKKEEKYFLALFLCKYSKMFTEVQIHSVATKIVPNRVKENSSLSC